MDYQEEIKQFIVYDQTIAEMQEANARAILRVYQALVGLNSEIGELANKLKKVVRGDYTLDHIRPELADELGDVRFYMADLCNALGLDEDIIETQNIAKLTDRKERGKIKGSGDHR